MLSKSVIQFSVDGWSCVPLPAIYLGPNYGGGDEDNGDLPQKIPCMYCYSLCPQPCSRPPPTHGFARDSQKPTGKSRTVSCGVTVPFSWVLVHKVLLCPPRVYFPVLCKFWQLYAAAAKSLQSSDSVRPHRQQPTKLPHPWDSPGKNIGVGCHFLLQGTKVKSESEVAQSCLTLSDPMDCSLPGSSVHGIFQARVLEWGAIGSSVVWVNGNLLQDPDAGKD